MDWGDIWKAVKSLGGPIIVAIIGFLKEAENRKKLTEALAWLRRVIADTTKISSSLGMGKRFTSFRNSQKNKQVVKALIVTMKVASPESRQGAGEALVAIGSPAVGLLCKELQDSEPTYRKSVAWALGDIGDVEALIPLVEASGDPDSETRAGIEEAIRKIITAYSSAYGPKDD